MEYSNVISFFSAFLVKEILMEIKSFSLQNI